MPPRPASRLLLAILEPPILLAILAALLHCATAPAVANSTTGDQQQQQQVANKILPFKAGQQSSANSTINRAQTTNNSTKHLQPQQRAKKTKPNASRKPSPALISQHQQQHQQSQDPFLLAQQEARRMLDYNNAPPYFITITRDLFVDLARYAPGTPLTTIKAVDVDGDQLEYSIQPGQAPDASAYFAINATSGELSLAQKPFKFYSIAVKDAAAAANPGLAATGVASPSDAPENDSSGDKLDLTEEDETSDQPQSVDRELISRNLYFLNVAANDGRYNSAIEFQVHVINSSAMADRSLVQLTPDSGRMHSQILDSLVKKKASDYYESQLAVNNLSMSSSAGNVQSYKVVYPDYVNPSITKPQSGWSEAEASSGGQLAPIEQSVDPNGSTSPTTSARISHTASLADAQPIGSEIANQPVFTDMKTMILPPNGTGGLPQIQVVGFSIFCSSFVLVMMVVILVRSYKQLKQRLMRIELHHHINNSRQHQTSSSSNCGSSSMVCSLNSSSVTNHNSQQHHHHNHNHNHLLPSLSRLTVGSDASTCANNYIGSQDQTSVFCHNTSEANLHLNNDNRPHCNKTIMNPNYLRNHMNLQQQIQQKQQQVQALHHQQFSVVQSHPLNHRPLHQNHQNQAPVDQTQRGLNGLISNQVHLGQQRASQRASSRPQPIVLFPEGSSENIYYPIEDEFYTTINSSVPAQVFQANNHCMAGNNEQEQQNHVADQAVHQSARQTDSPLSDSGSSIRSLLRFLSLPNRHQANVASIGDQQGSPTDWQASNKHHEQEDDLSACDSVKASKTIARGCHINSESDSWELDRCRLKPQNLIDEGQFGQVWRYLLKPPGTKRVQIVVAVKMLKLIASKIDLTREELLAEIDIMKKVCHHPNVVKILYCCTRNSLESNQPIMLVMEYLELGNLQSFLKQSRKSLQQMLSIGSQTSRCSVDGLEIYTSQNSDSQLTANDDSLLIDQHTVYQVTSRDLIKYAYHVAKGMEYISSKGIVHRDLASRNILVSSDRVCKIGDFGMARCISSLNDEPSPYGADNQGFYERHSRNTKIPVRWMAPEVMLVNRFTIKSDVFSMGILMWEIVTLGETPYRHLHTEQVMNAVAWHDERPDKPSYCHQELYVIMSKCWTKYISKRPTFSCLVKLLEAILLSTNNYIELDQYLDHNYSNVSNEITAD